MKLIPISSIVADRLTYILYNVYIDLQKQNSMLDVVFRFYGNILVIQN